MKQVHFIVNPIAGVGKHKLTHEYLEPYFKEGDYMLKVKYSNYRRHATELTQQSIKEGAAIVVACGGDGTINEVASCLVGSSIPLGIIPIGSGNGLASNLRIPSKLKEAISIVKQEKSMRIDVGSINGQYFFSNTGIGFDAMVIRNYEVRQKRTLFGYLRASLTSVRELDNRSDLTIEINGVHSIINPFMIFISNSNEMGYKVTLTPKASLQDGLLDVLIVPRIGKWDMFLLGLLMLLKKPHLLKQAKCFQTKDLQLLKIKGDLWESQIDGESHILQNGKVSVSIKEKSLKVLVLN